MFATHIDHLSTLTEKINSDHDINEITDSFISIMQNASSCMTKVKKKQKLIVYTQTQIKKPGLIQIVIMPDYFLKRLETNTPKTKVMQSYEMNFYTQNQITIKLSVIKNLSIKQVKKTN